ncbi:Universal stress protein family protein [Enhygromyxa salina]|uniref:Universal stress protein family protein n=1 Tax=Enhygromyxa salina TaxID=215803 RepID=A0A2S9XV79_9BACT|nr:universal stress protein [Enhygromyxa salina]PRP96765.1 Universal stress protein family protein [Enhygromyxa salina]
MTEHFVVLVTTSPSLHPSTRELATRLACRGNAVLLFLHIVPFSGSDGEAMLYSAVGVMSGTHEAWLGRQVPSRAEVRYRHRLAAGDPEQIVARFVAEHEVDLVVAEQPPRRWLSPALWRGFAERLVWQMPCPVVISGPRFLRSMPSPPPPAPRGLTHTNAADLLRTTVEARVEAVRCWMDHMADAVHRVAQSLVVRDAAASVGGTGLFDARVEQRLRVALDEHQWALHAQGWQLSVGEHSWGSGLVMPRLGSGLAAFLDRVHEHGSSTSLPLAVDVELDRLVLLAGAMVGGDGGLLLLAFDAETDFLRILGQPGPFPSFETYAFDEAGVMLSNSRFPDQLLQAGLLPAEGQQTPLRLRVAEPSDEPKERWPLTRMAEQATRQRDGFDTRGYRDYRGAQVVGAWRWVPEYGFGVTAELDRAAAYA